MKHMDEHVTFDPSEATHMEKMRAESISTLDMAQDIVSRLLNWLDELEAKKDSEGGITSEWVSDAAKLVGQANTSLKLVGQLSVRLVSIANCYSLKIKSRVSWNPCQYIG